MTAAEIADVLGAEVEGCAGVTVHGAEVDSRRLRAGDLFVALAGARCDGHEFVGTALETAAAALVKQNNTVDIRIKKLPLPGFASGTGAAMQKYHRQTISTAAFLDIQPVPVRHGNGMRFVGFNRGKQCLHRNSLQGLFACRF